jgi:hypothetical protein
VLSLNIAKLLLILKSISLIIGIIASNSESLAPDQSVKNNGVLMGKLAIA